MNIQLDSASTSSAMVLSGYTCAQIQVANQWLWLKRATNDEEEKDGIMDIHVTLGRLKLPSDSIWVSPGVGWIRVDGNFAKSSFLNQIDAFVWFMPSRCRSMETHMSSPMRSSIAISDESRLLKIMNMSRTAIRHFVPLFQLKKVANLHNDVEGRENTVTVPGASPNRNSTGSNAFLMHRTERIFDFSALYNKVSNRFMYIHKWMFSCFKCVPYYCRHDLIFNFFRFYVHDCLYKLCFCDLQASLILSSQCQ